jgi:hypothetical protein
MTRHSYVSRRRNESVVHQPAQTYSQRYLVANHIQFNVQTGARQTVYSERCSDRREIADSVEKQRGHNQLGMMKSGQRILLIVTIANRHRCAPGSALPFDGGISTVDPIAKPMPWQVSHAGESTKERQKRCVFSPANPTASI